MALSTWRALSSANIDIGFHNPMSPTPARGPIGMQLLAAGFLVEIRCEIIAHLYGRPRSARGLPCAMTENAEGVMDGISGNVVDVFS